MLSATQQRTAALTSSGEIGVGVGARQKGGAEAGRPTLHPGTQSYVQ